MRASPATHVEHAIRAVESGTMILPLVGARRGTFSECDIALGRRASRRQRCRSRAHLYAALVADVSLDLIGCSDTLVIDGRFSNAPVFAQSLARLRPATRVFIGNDENGVARGALRLATGAKADTAALERVSPLPVDLTEYRARWRESAERGTERGGTHL